MKTISAKQLAEIIKSGILLGDDAAMIEAGVSTDTRTIVPRTAFFALRGEKYNGDDYARQALEAGASVVVVHQWQGGDVPAGVAVIEAEDTLLALQKLAYWWRRQLDIPVVAITGSNGKTSTKDFTAAVLSRKFNVCSTQGNLNNHIGVPLSVLSATEQHTAAVFELGMNHPGEIAPLCEIAKPDCGIITNIGSAHIEFLGSRDSIAEEKGMLARAIPSDGILFLPAICEYYNYLRQRTRAAIVPVGNGRGLVRAENPHYQLDHTTFDLVIEGVGSAAVNLPVPGKHMITNALLAAGVGWKLGLPIEEIAAGLSSVKLSGGRLMRYDCAGVQVIDDTYNANPESMLAAIEALDALPMEGDGRKFIVMGQMAELGRHAEEAHRYVGSAAAERGLKVMAVGEGAQLIAEGAAKAPWFSNFEDAASWINGEVKAGDVILFKGSRSAALDVLMKSVFPKN